MGWKEALREDIKAERQAKRKKEIERIERKAMQLNEHSAEGLAKRFSRVYRVLNLMCGIWCVITLVTLFTLGQWSGPVAGIENMQFPTAEAVYVLGFAASSMTVFVLVVLYRLIAPGVMRKLECTVLATMLYQGKFKLETLQDVSDVQFSTDMGVGLLVISFAWMFTGYAMMLTGWMNADRIVKIATVYGVLALLENFKRQVIARVALRSSVPLSEVRKTLGLTGWERTGREIKAAENG